MRKKLSMLIEDALGVSGEFCRPGAFAPLTKIFFNRLLLGMLRGEDEYVVVGGMYDVQLKTM